MRLLTRWLRPALFCGLQDNRRLLSGLDEIPLVISHHENRAWGMPHDILGHAPQHKMLQASVPMGGDDDQVRTPGFRGPADFLGRAAGEDERFHLEMRIQFRLPETGSVTLGKGKPLFPRRVLSPVLRLTGVRHMGPDMVELRYDVTRDR